jgi:2-O-methyltransferase
VIWVEPIPEIFDRLKANLENYPRQRAFQYLVTDTDDKEYAFHVSNNEGKSSSILELKLHKDIWPEVAFTKSVTLRSVTLPSLLRREGLDVRNYDTLIMDTQGSELLVLKGAVPILPHLTFVKTEVSDFESYEGCCQLEDMGHFLEQHGFAERERHPFARRAEGGVYYDVTYERAPSQR